MVRLDDTPAPKPHHFWGDRNVLSSSGKNVNINNEQTIFMIRVSLQLRLYIISLLHETTRGAVSYSEPDSNVGFHNQRFNMLPPANRSPSGYMAASDLPTTQELLLKPLHGGRPEGLESRLNTRWLSLWLQVFLFSLSVAYWSGEPLTSKTKDVT